MSKPAATDERDKQAKHEILEAHYKKKIFLHWPLQFLGFIYMVFSFFEFYTIIHVVVMMESETRPSMEFFMGKTIIFPLSFMASMFLWRYSPLFDNVIKAPKAYITCLSGDDCEVKIFKRIDCPNHGVVLFSKSAIASGIFAWWPTVSRISRCVQFATHLLILAIIVVLGNLQTPYFVPVTPIAFISHVGYTYWRYFYRADHLHEKELFHFGYKPRTPIHHLARRHNDIVESDGDFCSSNHVLVVCCKGELPDHTKLSSFETYDTDRERRCANSHENVQQRQNQRSVEQKRQNERLEQLQKMLYQQQLTLDRIARNTTVHEVS